MRACQHIVIVSETFAPDINGVANTLLQLCRGLVAQGYRVSLIRPAPASDRRAGACAVTQGWCHAQLLVTGVPLPGYRSLRFGLASGRQIRRWLAAQAVDSVYVATQGPLGVGLLLASCGISCTLVYKLLKRWLIRERPFISFPLIDCGIPPLDRYSFPSGHTLHAVCFTLLLALTLPGLALLVLPFTLCVAASRVVLGLHYPSDVLAGAIIGSGLGLLGYAVLADVLLG